MLISLLVVGAVAVVLWITVGDMAQPATKDGGSSGSTDDDGAVTPNDAVGEIVPDEGSAVDVQPDIDEEPAIEVVPVPEAGTSVFADATAPAEGTVPQAVPARPAERAAVSPAPVSHPRVLPGSYSFEPAPPITWARRLRSALGVVLVITAVGLALAASVGVLAVFVSRALEGAVN
jgi:hypothetical protein